MSDRYVVVLTIDRYPPGTDVTDLYDADTLDRLIDEGYVSAEKPAAKAKKKRSG